MERRAIAVIPARGGSKRFPRKNMALLGGRPLLQWTLEAALASECFHSIIVSSDMPEALELAGQYGNAVRAMARPGNLAGDTATTPQVVADLARREQWVEHDYSEVCLLLPTAPLRTSTSIVQGRECLTETLDSVVAMSAYGVPPEWAFRSNADGHWEKVMADSGLAQGRTRTQGLAPAYHPNGAFYWGWLPAFLASGSFFSGRMHGFVLPMAEGLDIDYPEDLAMAEGLLHWRQALP